MVAITGGSAPKHMQVAKALTEMCRGLSPDSPVPSERQLMVEYGVSRDTIRKAVHALVSRGVVTRVPGKGTFVAAPRMESRLHLASFSEDMRRRGLTPSTRLLSAVLVPATGDVAAALQCPPDTSVWRIERIRLADGLPLAVEIGWYPRAVLVGIKTAEFAGSIYDLLRKTTGHAVDEGRQVLWAETADEPTAVTLQATTGSPLLVFKRVSYSGGVPVEFAISRYRGERYQVQMMLEPFKEAE